MYKELMFGYIAETRVPKIFTQMDFSILGRCPTSRRGETRAESGAIISQTRKERRAARGSGKISPENWMIDSTINPSIIVILYNFGSDIVSNALAPTPYTRIYE